MDDSELRTESREMREQLFRLRVQVGLGQTDGLKKYRALRKDRARVLTILRERELARQAGAQPKV
jgi:large subunit ribosomal protein L29